MKRSNFAIGSFALIVLLVILLWTSLSAKSQGGRAGLRLKDEPSSTQTAVVQLQARASNLLLVEFFAGY